MVDPNTLNTKNFNNVNVLYNDGRFAIAQGVWTNTTEVELAMRWNGDEEEAKGYPKGKNGNPQWFLVHRPIAKFILQGLLDDANTTSDKKRTIKELLQYFD